MTRRNLVAVLVIPGVALLGLGVGLTTAIAQEGGGCQMQGTANLSPGLGTSSQAFTYNFTGNLSSCQSSTSGAPATGTTSAGLQLPETVTLTNTSTGATQPGSVQYQEPVPTGTGSCGSSTTSGQALTTWADGTHTVASYSTSGAAAAVLLQGSVIPSMTLQLVSSSVPAGFSAPATFTIGTDRMNVGDSVLAPLTFSPSTQAQDCVTVPVTQASINGAVTIGSA
jgi:hypothetical protein